MRSAIIVANGTSSRFGSDKLSVVMHGKSVLQHSIDAFVSLCDEIIVVCDKSRWTESLEGATLVEGGATRRQSVLCGLSAVSDSCTCVAIHDGARPYVTKQLIARLFEQAEMSGSAVPACVVTDTVYTKDQQLMDRDNLVAVQTPQVFDRAKLMLALDDNGTDEAQSYIARYGAVSMVEGQVSNVKLTYSNMLPSYRVGNGYDIHRMTSGSGIVLGGVAIECDRQMIAHSDGDVVVHAIMDSLLASLSLGDIGRHFPDDDSNYSNIDSMQLLDRVVAMVTDSGYDIVNVSVVVIAQYPHLAGHINNMRQTLADRLGVARHCVGITATTTERLGVVGNGDAIAVEAHCLVVGG